MITVQEAEDFLHGIFTEVWTHRDKNAVAKFYHPDFIGLLHGNEEFKFEDVLKRVDYSLAHYKDNKFSFEEILVVEPNRIVTRWSMTNIDKITGEKNSLNFMTIIEMKEGKMFRQWTLSSQPYVYKAWE